MHKYSRKWYYKITNRRENEERNKTRENELYKTVEQEREKRKQRKKERNKTDKREGRAGRRQQRVVAESWVVVVACSREGKNKGVEIIILEKVYYREKKRHKRNRIFRV